MPAISNDYVIINIGQSNEHNSFDELVSCSDSKYWLTEIEEELKSMHENDVDILLIAKMILNQLAVNGFKDQEKFKR